jgi:hypothetical protein
MDYVDPSKENIVNVQFHKAIDLTKSGHQDVGRMKLPMIHHAPFTYQCSWRTALSILKSLKVLSPNLYWIHYGLKWMEQLGLTEESLDKCPYKPLHHQYVLQTNDWTEGSQEYAGIRVVNCTIPIGLRAQLVRQIQIRVYDDMWSDIAGSSGRLEYSTLEESVRCTVVMSNSAYDVMATKRSCLIAQTELWWKFIESHWGEKGKNALPCRCDRELCTVKAEAEQCLRGEASTTSCPIYDGNPKSLKIRADYMGQEHPAIQLLLKYRPDLNWK